MGLVEADAEEERLAAGGRMLLEDLDRRVGGLAVGLVDVAPFRGEPAAPGELAPCQVATFTATAERGRLEVAAVVPRLGSWKKAGLPSASRPMCMTLPRLAVK